MSGTAQQLGILPTDPATALGVNAADPVPQMPGLGPLPGQLTLNPQIAPQVQGNARPLAPGEYLMNPDGGWSSEMTYTVPYGDGWAVLPGMWIVDGKPVHVDEDQATAYAKQTGLNFPTYPDEATATKASEDREAGWQNMRPQDAGKVAPLWSRPQSSLQSGVQLAGDVVPFPQKPEPLISPDQADRGVLTPNQMDEYLKNKQWPPMGGAKPEGGA